MTLLAILALGFFLGVRHATDSDHVVTVTTIVARARSPLAALSVGALWGLGHSATILLVGGAIVVFGWVIPPRLGLSLELSAAVMLIVLGLMNLTSALARRDNELRAQPAAAGSILLGSRASLRPLAVGVVHGLAGSAAVALLVLASIKSAHLGLVYLAVFGTGTVAGMMLLTLAMSLPIRALASRYNNAGQLMARVTGLVSVAFGLFLAYRIGIADGLFVGTPSWTPH
jgi:high-affinity nickel-transport protein